MNDIMCLDDIGICSVACSNRATDAQVELLNKFAKRAANSRIALFHGCDEEGETGFKDLLWKLSEHHLDVRLGLSSKMFNGKFANQQPESLSVENWQLITARPNDNR